MPTLVDCYNLLHTTMPPGLAGLDESRLCALLGRVGDGQAVVVCDGVPKPGLPSRSNVPGVDLVYSGKDRTADDLIIDLVNRDSAPRRLTVVTNDREIQKAAKRRRARVVSCEAFIGELIAARGPAVDGDPGEGQPEESLESEEVEKWMRRFGFKDDGGEPPPGSRHELG